MGLLKDLRTSFEEGRERARRETEVAREQRRKRWEEQKQKNLRK